MTVNNETASLVKLGVAAGVPVDCDMYLLRADDLVVYYGAAGDEDIAVYGADYTLSGIEAPWDDFTLTPTASLITKIGAGTNRLRLIRDMSYTSAFTAQDANFRQRIADEFDRQILLVQQQVDRIETLGADVAALQTIATDVDEARDGAEAAYDNMQKLHLGGKTVDPTLDNDGNALVVGTTYFNIPGNEMRVWNGTTWTATYVPVAGYATISYVNSSIAALTKSSVGLANVDNTSDVNKPVSTAQQTALDGKEDIGRYTAVRDITLTSDTLVLADRGKLVRTTNASATTITVPPQASVAWLDRTRIDFMWYAAGQPTFAPGSGVTIRSEDSKLKIAKRYGMASLIRVASNEWVLIGNLAT